MAQNDFVVANADGATVRADINSALQALATLSSGAAAPGTTYAGMIWGDTTNLVAKQRNQANTTWRVIATLDEDLVIGKTGNYSALLRDFGKTIRADGSGNPPRGLTVRLPAAATAGDGYTITVVNVGATETITVDGNGAETVNGAANHTLDNQYDAATYRCDGAVWGSGGRGVGHHDSRRGRVHHERDERGGAHDHLGPHVRRRRLHHHPNGHRCILEYCGFASHGGRGQLAAMGDGCGRLCSRRPRSLRQRH